MEEHSSRAVIVANPKINLDEVTIKAKFQESLKFILYITERHYLKYGRIAVYRPSCHTLFNKTRRTNFKEPLYTERYYNGNWWYTIYFKSDLGTLKVNDLVGVRKDPNCWF